MTTLSKERNLGGRPRLYATPEQFESKVGEYEAFCEQKGYPITWTGLALFMGFSSRQSIDEYAKYEGFSDCVKKAKSFVEWHYEMKLASGESPAGSIFALKNFGWKDKQETEISGGVEIKQTLAQRLTGGSKR